jgi:tetratricopeptide (TPR) repeat protein
MPIKRRLFIGVLAAVLSAGLAAQTVAQTVAQAAMTLQTAAARGLVDYSFEGTGSSSGDSVRLKVKRTPKAPNPITITVPSGTVLRSGGAEQSMVVSVIRGIDVGGGFFEPTARVVLRGSAGVTAILSAFCAEFEKDNPSASTPFTLEQPDPKLACLLTRSRGLSVPAQQAAVWMHTDKVTYQQMSEKFSITQADWSAAERVVRTCATATPQPGEAGVQSPGIPIPIVRTAPPVREIDYNERGRAKQAGGDLDGALADYSRAISSNPQAAYAYRNRGMIKLAKGDLDGAIADDTRAIEIDPQLAMAYADRGLARHRKADLNGALEDYTRSIELDPKVSAALYRNSGLIKLDRGDFDGTVADNTVAVELDPKFVLAYVDRGRARDANGDSRGALADYSMAIGLDSRNSAARLLRALVRQATGDFSGALVDHAKVIESSPKEPYSYIGRAYVRRLSADTAGALADLTRAISLNSKISTAYRDRGFVKFGARDLPGAILDLTRAIELSPNSEDADYSGLYMWVARMRLGKRQNAVQELSSLLARRQVAPAASWPMTIAAFLLGQRDETDLLKEAEKGDSKGVKGRLCEAYFFVGALRLLNRDRPGAGEFFRKSVATGERRNTEYAGALVELRWLK